MSYLRLFTDTDAVFGKLDQTVGNLNDPMLESKFVGLVAVTAVTVFELCVKEIFFDFANKKHHVFGEFTQSHFYRINGRIKKQHLCESHIPMFGDKYLKKFNKISSEAEARIFRETGQSLFSSYGNIITWRHQFAHQGTLPAYATYSDARSAYQVGKEMIVCLDLAMRR